MWSFFLVARVSVTDIGCFITVTDIVALMYYCTTVESVVELYYR
jgi:hypothetical protein